MKIMTENQTKIKTIDIATSLTIGGILLYVFGWMYWTKYFSTLNINSSYINLSFEKIIATTWLLILNVIGGFLISIHHFFERKESDLDAMSSIYVIICSIFILIGFATNDNFWYTLLLGFFLLYAIVMKVMIKTGKKFGRMSKNIFINISIVLIFLSSSMYYNYKGEKDAKKMLEDYSEIISGKFITFMNEKYFLIIENSKCKKELIVINNEQVFSAKFTNKK
ncbi:hypothetical protein D3C85_1235270 [compost metagenome]